MKNVIARIIEVIRCSVFMLFLFLLSGCVGKAEVLPFAVNYKTKQVRFADSSINYVVCKDCVQYTKVQSFQIFQGFRNFQNYQN